MLLDTAYESPTNNWYDAVAGTERERRVWVSHMVAMDSWRDHLKGRLSRTNALRMLSAISIEMVAIRLEGPLGPELESQRD